MAINLRQVWRVGSSWGGFPIIEFFREKQIVFFGRDSSRLGHYYEAKVGDLLAITKPNSKKVVAVARMESTFTGLSSWSIGYQNSICKYCNGKSDNIIICNATIIDIISDDYFDCSDYKRFSNMGHHEKINELWKRYFEENKSEIKERGWFYLRQLGTGLNFIKIPPVQRGLVWKPRQIELLWDSILRRFPIGSTIMYLNENGFELLDGQQRQNAIRIGYSNIYNNEIRLWLDLGIKNISSRYSKRKYWVRAITKAHPWGFQLNDECTPLSAGERRNALRDFGYDEGATISNCDINLDKCWPYVGSVCPIPLDIVFKHADKDVEAFTKGCIEDCKVLPLFITNAISSHPSI